MKRIAIISCMSGVGGTERSLLSFLRNIPEGIFEVDVFLIGDIGPLAEEIPHWVNVVPIKKQTFAKFEENSLKSKHFIKALKGLINYIQIKLCIHKYKCDTMKQYRLAMPLFSHIEKQYDAAISWAVPNSFATVYTLKEVNATRKILWIHMDVLKDRMPPDAGNVFKEYDKIYCVSKACKNSFDAKYPNLITRTEVFYNYIETDRIRALSKEKTEIDDITEVKIVTCGRIAPEKQPLLGVELAKHLIEDGVVNFHWYFIGDGVLSTKMKEIIKNEHLERYISLMGNLLNPYSCMSRADLYVQMSLHESYCLTLAEAQTLCIPCLSTDFPSAWEIIDNRVTGYIISNKKDFYAQLKTLVANPELLKRLKGNSKENRFDGNSMNDLISYIGA